MKTRLLEIINAGANKLTKDDRIFIKVCASSLGQNMPSGTCKNCYIDTAVMLVKRLEELEAEEAEEMVLQQKLVEAKYIEPESREDALSQAKEIVEASLLEPEPRKIQIKKGVDIIVNGQRVNRYTITTDAQAEALLKIIDRKYFEFL